MHRQISLPFHSKKWVRRSHVNPSRKSRKFTITLSESSKRLLQIFVPFGIVLITVVIAFTLMIQLVYLQPLRENIEDSIWKIYKMYLTSINNADKNQLIISYQQITTSVQVTGLFMKNLMISSNPAIADVANWDANASGVYTDRNVGVGVPNFRNLNDFTTGDICPFQTYYNNNENSTVSLNYRKRQYFGWSNWQESRWDQLQSGQREYLLKNDFAQSVSKSMYYQQSSNQIQMYSFYNAKADDDTWYGFHPTERITAAGRFWNTQAFGGPFNCTKNVNNAYNEYVLPSADYYVGKDQSYKACAKAADGISCLCPYYETPRKFPIVWRCRPWYVASIQNGYVTFADAYADVNTGNLITTVSFKLVDSSSGISSISDEDSASAYGVHSIDLNIGNLQSTFGKGNLTTEYTYLVAPSTYNFDTNNGSYYSYTAFVHPLMNGTKMSVVDLEFSNSTNRVAETAAYLEKTTFLKNSTIRRNGCSEVNEAASYQMDITKNQTDFYTIFSEIRVCYGNFEEQKSLTVGFLARCITQDKKYEITSDLRSALDDMQLIIILSLVSSFIGCLFILYFVLRQFLQYNFEVPIQILSHVILEAGPQEIHKLNVAIEKGELKTQLELRNLLQAISSVVINVQTKVQLNIEDLKSESVLVSPYPPHHRIGTRENNQQSENEVGKDEQVLTTPNAPPPPQPQQHSDFEANQLMIFHSALNTFMNVDHKIGMGLCFNNIGNIFMRRRDFQSALLFYKKAYLLSQEEFYNEVSKNKEKDINHIEQLCTDPSKRNFMKIYASRKFQIGSALLQAVIQSRNSLFTEDRNYSNLLLTSHHNVIAATVPIPNSKHNIQQQPQQQAAGQLVSPGSSNSDSLITRKAQQNKVNVYSDEENQENREIRQHTNSQQPQSSQTNEDIHGMLSNLHTQQQFTEQNMPILSSGPNIFSNEVLITNPIQLRFETNPVEELLTTNRGGLNAKFTDRNHRDDFEIEETKMMIVRETEGMFTKALSLTAAAQHRDRKTSNAPTQVNHANRGYNAQSQQQQQKQNLNQQQQQQQLSDVDVSNPDEDDDEAAAAAEVVVAASATAAAMSLGRALLGDQQAPQSFLRPSDLSNELNRVSYVNQAIDVFFDAKDIFEKLGDYCGENSYSDAYEFYCFSVMSLLKLAECQLLVGSRIFVVRELLKTAKVQIRMKIRKFTQQPTHVHVMMPQSSNNNISTTAGKQQQLHQSNLLFSSAKRTPVIGHAQNSSNNGSAVVGGGGGVGVWMPQEILVNKYYLLKAKLRMAEEAHAKALKNLLQCLNYSVARPNVVVENDRSLYSYYNSEAPSKLDHFDPTDTIEVLTLIKTVLSLEHISIHPWQLSIIEKDILASKSLSEESTEPYFFEVFFKDPNTGGKVEEQNSPTTERIVRLNSKINSRQDIEA